MRIFVGIPAGEIILQNVRKWRIGFGIEDKIRWIKDENLHLTLVPPWYSDKIDEIGKVISDVELIKKPFEIKFNTIEFGPLRDKRLIWVRGDESEKLNSLRYELHKVLGRIIEKRAFAPHFTIARFKKEDFKNFINMKLNEIIYWKMKVDKFVLYQSKLSSKGSEYRILKEFY